MTTKLELKYKYKELGGIFIQLKLGLVERPESVSHRLILPKWESLYNSTF